MPFYTPEELSEIIALRKRLDAFRAKHPSEQDKPRYAIKDVHPFVDHKIVFETDSAKEAPEYIHGKCTRPFLDVLDRCLENRRVAFVSGSFSENFRIRESEEFKRSINFEQMLENHVNEQGKEETKTIQHPDDIFLWPDDDWCYRRDWENGKVSGRSDDFVVVPLDSEKYDGVSEGSISYNEVCNSQLGLELKEQQQSDPWLPTSKEIDKAPVADVVKPISEREIKDLSGSQLNVKVHPEIDRTEVKAIAAEQKLSGVVSRGPVVTVSTDGCLGSASPQRIRLNLSPVRNRGLDR